MWVCLCREAPVQSRWGTQVVGTNPPPGLEGRLDHGGLPTTGWGEVGRNGNDLTAPQAKK